jgi:hypothetical protein
VLEAKIQNSDIGTSRSSSRIFQTKRRAGVHYYTNTKQAGHINLARAKHVFWRFLDLPGLVLSYCLGAGVLVRGGWSSLPAAAGPPAA